MGSSSSSSGSSGSSGITGGKDGNGYVYMEVTDLVMLYALY